VGRRERGVPPRAISRPLSSGWSWSACNGPSHARATIPRPGVYRKQLFFVTEG